MLVTADAAICCGSGQCALVAPGVFDQREEDGTVLLLNDCPPDELLTRVREAEIRCPSGAITVTA